MADIPTEPIWRLSVTQYHAMITAGILADDDPVELLEGWLVRRARKTPRHSTAMWRMRHALEVLVPAGWYVESHGAITLDDSEPEPDVGVVRGDALDYRERHPGPQDAALVIEVADATLARDRGMKKRLYAQARIAVYWIVNLIDRRVEVYTGPGAAPDYARRQDYGEADAVPLVLDGREVGRIAVRDLLP